MSLKQLLIAMNNQQPFKNKFEIVHQQKI